LIVDEAGQVAPEIGIPVFALAKKALVVGDIKQIEPVWNILSVVDAGNLKQVGLISGYHDKNLNKLRSTGLLSSSGSIMQVAQMATAYTDLHVPESGILLSEHRRCYDEIIAFCNEVAYEGLLEPMKGKSTYNPVKGIGFPPMLSIHVNGQSVSSGGSRSNNQEAIAIANWIMTNKQGIESCFKTSIDKSVAIITPFLGQKNLIKATFRKMGLENLNGITIGTVHALQGAEREIILFSAVYGANEVATMFFDIQKKPNLLNVAVSRAKSSFILFANQDIFVDSSVPSGILYKHMKQNERILLLRQEA
jgi:superfamily I DNA and/or RNA helicase